MQRTEPDGIIIACDFCGTDWDERRPMIEGHRGSVLCLDCLKFALVMADPAAELFDCTLCLRSRPAGTIAWHHPDCPPSSNPDAAVCAPCLKQAAGMFSKDPDIDWKWDRKIGSKSADTIED